MNGWTCSRWGAEQLNLYHAPSLTTFFSSMFFQNHHSFKLIVSIETYWTIFHKTFTKGCPMTVNLSSIGWQIDVQPSPTNRKKCIYSLMVVFNFWNAMQFPCNCKKTQCNMTQLERGCSICDMPQTSMKMRFKSIKMTAKMWGIRKSTLWLLIVASKKVRNVKEFFRGMHTAPQQSCMRQLELH